MSTQLQVNDGAISANRSDASTTSQPSTPTSVITNIDSIFPFMRLPAETRNAIYEEVYIDTGGYIGRKSCAMEPSTNQPGFRREAGKTRNLSFAMTCRQIYEETCSIFFGYNGFSFEDPAVLLEFLQSIGIKNRERLTKISYIHTVTSDILEDDKHSYAPGSFFALRYLRSCINLQDLDIYLLMDTKGSSFELGKIARLENSKKFFLTSSTVIDFDTDSNWLAPVRLAEAIVRLDPNLMEIVPLPRNLNAVGISKMRENTIARPPDIYTHGRICKFGFLQSLPTMLEQKLSLYLNDFTQLLRQIKTDADASFPRRIYQAPRLPDVFGDSKDETELFGTNFKTQEEKDVARTLTGLMDRFGEPPMDVEYIEGTSTRFPNHGN